MEGGFGNTAKFSFSPDDSLSEGAVERMRD